MLKDSGEEISGADLKGLTLNCVSRKRYLERSWNDAVFSRNAQASFFRCFGFDRVLGEAGIQDGVKFIVEFRDKDSIGQADLIGGQSHSTCRFHNSPHRSDDLAALGSCKVIENNLFCLPAEEFLAPRIAQSGDNREWQDSHRRDSFRCFSKTFIK